MKKVIIVIIAVVVSTVCSAQDKYISKNGHVGFLSKTPMENIEAHNNQVSSYIETKTGNVAFQLLMKSFKFDRALMEEHFNENYVESAKFPKADFKGTITNVSAINFSKDGTYNATVDGNMTIHGVTKKITEKGTVEVKGGKVLVKSKFNIIPQDYGIAIPDLVKEKFAKSMNVTVDISYDPYKK